MRRDDNRWRNTAREQIVLHNRAQRRAMQVIEVRMRDQHQVNGRKIGDPHSGSSQALEHKQPPREIWIDDHALSAHLQEEAGMSNEGNAQFSVRGQAWLVGLAASPSHGGMAHQTGKLSGSLPKGGIAQSLLDHRKRPRRYAASQSRDEVLNILDDFAPLQAAFYYLT